MPVSDKKPRISDSSSFSMALTLSSIADKSSVLYEGRAKVREIADIRGMEKGAWKERLADALKAKGKSKREVSLAAGLNPGYIHSILVEGKDPTIGNLMTVCAVLGVSLSSILYGMEITPETEAILRELEQSTPARRDGLLQFLRESDPGKNVSPDPA